jgi:hypothetical protein
LLCQKLLASTEKVLSALEEEKGIASLSDTKRKMCVKLV